MCHRLTMMDVRQAMATTKGDLWLLPQHDDIIVTSEEDNSLGELTEEDDNKSHAHTTTQKVYSNSLIFLGALG